MFSFFCWFGAYFLLIGVPLWDILSLNHDFSRLNKFCCAKKYYCWLHKKSHCFFNSFWKKVNLVMDRVHTSIPEMWVDCDIAGINCMLYSSQLFLCSTKKIQPSLSLYFSEKTHKKTFSLQLFYTQGSKYTFFQVLIIIFSKMIYFFFFAMQKKYYC